MSDETDSKVPLQPVSADDQNDNLAGASVLTLLQRSAYMAEGNSQYAVDIAKDLSRRLVASQARVAELEGRLAELESRFKSIEIDLSRRNSGSTRFRLSFRDGSRESHSEAHLALGRRAARSPKKSTMSRRRLRLGAVH
jgi:hypothetical protein